MDDSPRPRAIHSPTILVEERNKTYEPQQVPPAGNDEQGPFWYRYPLGPRAGLTRCPDCGEDMIGAHDIEVARAGFNFLVCFSLAYPKRLPANVVPSHEGCSVACGRMVETLARRN